jgi:tetratricopeptide (TPR) repeat protein
MRVAHLPAAAAVFGLMIAVAAGAWAQTGAAAATDAGTFIGTDFNGARCRWQARTDVPREHGTPLPAYIFCDGSKRPSGSVAATLVPADLPTDAAARHRALERAAAETPAGLVDSERLICGAAQWAKTPGGIDLMLQPCAFSDDEWPQVLAVAVEGRWLLRAEGLASGIPAYEQAMARLAGLSGADAAAPFGPVAATRARMVKLGGTGWLRASAGDYDAYGALTEAARVESSRKNFGAAEDHYRRALAILTKVFGDRSTNAALLLSELALQISNQERFDEAAALFRRAEPIINSSGSPSDRARLQLYLAFDAANRGRFDEALDFAANAASVWRELANQGGGLAAALGGSGSQSAAYGELAFALDLEAEMALRTGNLAASDAAVTEAEGIVAQVHDLPPWWRVEILTTIAEIRAAQGRQDSVDASFRTALILDERYFGNTAPTAVTDLVIGRIFTEEKRYVEAVRAFRLALGILDRDEVARSAVIVDQIAPFVVAANAVAEADPSQRAQLQAELFEAAQLIGKSLVDDTVNRVAARLAAAAPAIAGLVVELEATRRQRDAARLALAHEVSLPNDQRGSDRENALMAAINQATAKAEALQKRIVTEFPAYAKFANPGPVPLAELQKALHPGEALVLIEAGRARSFEMVVRSDRLIARPMDTDADTLADDIGDLRKAFVVSQGGIQAFDTEAAYDLYRSLFGAIESGLDGVDHMIVVPTGALASLPLGLLVTERPKPGATHDYARVQWLLRRTAISEVPSARGFITLRDAAASAAATRPLLAVGDPDFGGGGRGGDGGGGWFGLGGRHPPRHRVRPRPARQRVPRCRPRAAAAFAGAAAAAGYGGRGAAGGCHSQGRSRLDPSRRGGDRAAFPRHAAGAISRALFRHAWAAADRAALSIRAGAGAVAAARAGGDARRRRRARCERGRAVAPQCRPGRALGLQHRVRERPVRRRVAVGPGGRVLPRRRARRAGQPLGGSVGPDGAVDDRAVPASRPEPVRRHRRGLAPVAARSHCPSRDGAPVLLGGVHPHRRRRPHRAAPKRGWVRRGHPGGGGGWTGSTAWGDWSMICWFVRGGLSLAVSVVAVATAAAAQLVVVNSHGIRLTPGQQIDGSKPFPLHDGQEVTLMAPTGQVVTLQGPSDTAPDQHVTGGSTNFTGAVAALITERKARTSEVGVVRGEAKVVLPNPWVVDVTHPGTSCVQLGRPMVLWRSGDLGETPVSIAPADRSWIVSGRWPAGAAELSMPATLPLRDQTSYVITVGGKMAPVTLRIIPAAVGNDVMRASWMGEVGCDNQANALLALLDKK